MGGPRTGRGKHLRRRVEEKVTVKPSVFVSYRRQDAEVFAGRLYDTLVQEFGEDRVFMDVDTLKPGDDYIKAIERKLRHIDVFLAVIGNQWVTVKDERGSPRLADERDLLRLEVATALKRSIRVIPVLVGGATMPPVSDLPADIANVSRLHAFELTSARFRADVQLLVNTLRGGERGPGAGETSTRRWSWITPLAAIQPVVFGLCGVLLHLQAETNQYLYPSTKSIFFGALPVGLTLAVLSWRSNNSPGVFQGFAQLVFGAGAALALPGIDNLQSKTVALGLYVVATLFMAFSWWTIRTVPLSSPGPRAQIKAGRAAASVDDVSERNEGQEDSAGPIPEAQEEGETDARQARRPGRLKRVSAYLLVSLDLLGLFLFVAAAVLPWTDRQHSPAAGEAFLVGSLTLGPGMLSLILFGWIAEVRLCWMLGLATLAPFVFLMISGMTSALTPLALAVVAGIAVAAFAVETLRRLRRSFVP